MTTLKKPNRVILHAASPSPDAERKLAAVQSRLVKSRRQAKDAQLERDALILWMNRDLGYPASRLRDVIQSTGNPISLDAVEKVIRNA